MFTSDFVKLFHYLHRFSCTPISLNFKLNFILDIIHKHFYFLNGGFVTYNNFHYNLELYNACTDKH